MDIDRLQAQNGIFKRHYYQGNSHVPVGYQLPIECVFSIEATFRAHTSKQRPRPICAAFACFQPYI